MRIRQLQAFQYVLSSRTLTVAADLFGVTQPAMSRLIAQLEEEVGCRLLLRERGSIRLTEEGARFYESAEKVLAAMSELTGVAERLREDPRGTVRIVSMYGLINNLTPTVLTTFAAEQPAVRITIDVLNRTRLEEVIREQEFDIALATLPVKAPPSLRIDGLGRLPAVCIVPLAHPLASRTVIDAQDLDGIPFVSARRETLLRQRVDAVFGELGVKPRMQFECHNTEVMCDVVAAGLGVSVVHPFIAQADHAPFVTRPFRPDILMEYAMLRQAAGQSSTAAELLARRILAEAPNLRGAVAPVASLT